MLVLRPARESDLSALVELASSVDGSLTTLPPDREFLHDRLEEAVRSFQRRVRRPGAEYYLFVLEDTDTDQLVGTSGIAARVGGFDPFYSYDIRTERFAHPPLKIEKDVPVLHLREVHQGPTELCSLFLRSDRRHNGAGRLLSLGRFLFIAAFPLRFDVTIIAELRGYLDQQGRSPFWESVGRHFFQHDFYTADNLCGLGNKEFIADLMPRHPIYIPLLPPEVQAVIGKVHHQTLPAQTLLHSEGFTATKEVDIFDAGPLLRAATAQVRTIREATTARVKKFRDLAPSPPTHLLANGAMEFRACLGHMVEEPNGILLSPETAEALKLNPGDRVWHAPLRASTKSSEATS